MFSRKKPEIPCSFACLFQQGNVNYLLEPGSPSGIIRLSDSLYRPAPMKANEPPGNIGGLDMKTKTIRRLALAIFALSLTAAIFTGCGKNNQKK